MSRWGIDPEPLTPEEDPRCPECGAEVDGVGEICIRCTEEAAPDWGEWVDYYENREGEGGA